MSLFRCEEFDSEFGQNHRHHLYCYPEHTALRALYVLAPGVGGMFLNSVALHPCDSRPRALKLLRHSVALYSTIFLLLIAQTTTAQDSQSTNDDVIRIRTDLISVPVSVTDSRGRRVYGLKQEDFELTDEGRAAKIEYFAVGTERVALAFLLDASGSARDIITHQRETALALLSRFGRGSRVAVLRFRETTQLVAPFSTDASEALPVFRLPAIAGSRTAIFDAALTSLRAFQNSGNDRAERRIVVLISDGLDTASTTRAEAVIAEAKERGVSFYIIHLPLFVPRDGQLVARPASKGFRELAEKTGGRYFRLGDAKSSLDPRAEYDLAPLFRAIEEDLRGQYVLGFYPAEGSRDNRFHRLGITLTSNARRNLRVLLLREGYILKQ